MSIKYANVYQSPLAQGLELLVIMIFRQWELRLGTWDNYCFPIISLNNSPNKCLFFSTLSQNWFRSVREELYNCCLHIPVRRYFGKVQQTQQTLWDSLQKLHWGLLISGILPLSLQLGQKACQILGFRHKCLCIWEVDKKKKALRTPAFYLTLPWPTDISL